MGPEWSTILRCQVWKVTGKNPYPIAKHSIISLYSVSMAPNFGAFHSSELLNHECFIDLIFYHVVSDSVRVAAGRGA